MATRRTPSRTPSARTTPSRRRPAAAPASPLVGILMGSKSDWPTMAAAAETLDELGVPYEARVLSAHRTPQQTMEYSRTAEERGLEVIIAGAGSAAHLPGVVAALTALPVLGVPLEANGLGGLDALLAIVQMPKGVPVGTLAIGKSGAANAALLAANILGGSRPVIRERLKAWRAARAQEVLAQTLP